MTQPPTPKRRRVRPPLTIAAEELAALARAIRKQGTRPTARKMGVRPMVAHRLLGSQIWPRLDDLALACRATGTRILIY